MHLSKSYTAVEVHAEGEQGTCYLGSVFDVPGATMRDKLRHINEVDDTIRRFLCHEPRGRPQRVRTSCSRPPIRKPMPASSSSRPIVLMR